MNKIENGFYYHYKHDPKGDVGNYAYEVLNIGHHTEMHDTGDDGLLVIYRPLYEAFVYKEGKHWDARPLPMFLESVIKDGKEMDRFSKIKDPVIIEQLEKIKNSMYQD